MNIDYTPTTYSTVRSADWCQDAVIYQINTRQFTPQGTFHAACAHLPRLKALGVDILWLMPIHPIGEKNRKGSLGSPYAVKDYLAVNPELGDMASLTHFVQAAHASGFKVILDWVANHSAWDNLLVDTHPEWYATDHAGQFTSTPWWDWDDVIDFDYTQTELREYMAAAMRFWVEQADVDGFRCDVAGFIANDFWSKVRKELEQIKPIFMLAEWESKDLHQTAFDMTYAWSWNETMQSIAQQQAPLSQLYKYYSWQQKNYPCNAHRMTFVSNHDKNAWDGTQFEQFGDCLPAAIALSVLGEGMPLIYNGQEAGNNKRLAFFERDPIEWRAHPIGDLYRDLIMLKKAHTALHNAQWGAPMIHLRNNHSELVFSFIRQDRQSKIMILLNFSAQAVSVGLQDPLCCGDYLSYFDDTKVRIDCSTRIDLSAWDYRIFVQRHN